MFFVGLYVFMRAVLSEIATSGGNNFKFRANALCNNFCLVLHVCSW